MRRFGGRPLDPAFGISAAGADSLHLNLADFELRRLPAKLADILAAFTAEDYKQAFPFLDYFRKLPRHDPMIAVLNDRLDDLLQARSPAVGFAGPDDLQQLHPDGYELRYRRRYIPVAELTADRVYDALDELNAWHRTRDRVRVIPQGGDVPDDEQYTLGRYLVANVQADENGVDCEFALTASSWFKIDQSYAERIERFMRTVEDITDELGLPDWDDKWLQANVEGKYAEQRYNRLVSEDRGYRLLDRNMYIGPAHTGQRVEVCDLLTSRKELICVKRLDGAESLIHLFEQGALSAGMMRDDAYRQRVVQDLQACGGSQDFGQNSEWKFVFAIATSRPQPLHDLFTFFAKVALNSNANMIEGRGFNMKIAKINRTV